MHDIILKPSFVFRGVWLLFGSFEAIPQLTSGSSQKSAGFWSGGGPVRLMEIPLNKKGAFIFSVV